MTYAINLHAVAQLSAEKMLNCIVGGMAIALFAWLLLRAIGRQDSGRENSGTRFAVWLAALFAIAALPFASFLMPAATAAGSSAVSHLTITVPGAWATYLFALWAVVATLGLARVGVGLWRVRGVRQGCVQIEAANLDPALRATLNEFCSPRSVAICVSDSLQVPTAIGFVRPIVAFPAWTIRELSPTELNTILLHELAHLRRWDDWTNLAQKLLRAVLFFHPAIWWIEGKLTLEREMACDDAVLAETANPRAYAECLVTMAEKSLMRRGLAMAQAAVSRVRQTTQRVAQILDKNRTGATRIWKPAVGMVAAFAIACVGLLSQSPELVSFHEKGPVANLGSAARSASLPAAELKLASAAPRPAKFAVAPREGHAARARRAPEISAKAVAAQAEDQTILPVETVWEPSPQDLEAMLVPVRFAQASENAPKADFTNQPGLRFKSVVLVYQGLHYDDDGVARWTVCVWRVSVPVRQQAIAANPPKST